MTVLKSKISKVLKLFASALLLFCASALFCPFIVSSPFALSDDDIASYQREIADRTIGERIALWAEKYVGTPYDPDPLGEYVTKKSIVADGRVDCMYLSFRAVELAMSHSPEEAVQIALDKRFMDKGILRGEKVVNYEGRFQYGEDMLDSKKWGKEITGDIGPVTFIKGARGREKVEIVSKDDLKKIIRKRGKDSGLKDGDFIFFVKSPEKRVVGEIVGHIGIIKLEGKDLYLIHASGRKNKAASGGSKNFWSNGGEEVKKVLFYDYISSMPFAGVKVGRFR